MNIFKMMDSLLRDRDSLYTRAAAGDGLARLCLKLLLLFVVASGLYGAAMGSFRCIHPGYFFSDFELTANGDPVVSGKVAGIDAEARKIYVAKGQSLPKVENAEVCFNVTRPTEPYKVAAVSEEKGYGVITLAADAQLAEPDAWRLPLLVAAKVPALFLLTLVVCCLVLYILNLAFGMGLHFLPTMTLVTFALAATGVMLGVFVPIAVLFAVVTENYHFMKLLHLFVFGVSGLFGVRVLYEGLTRLAPESVGRHKTKALVLSWLLLYSLVGGQLAWTLKPFLGTPYLPATPPFRVESGNIYVSVFESVSQLPRSARR